MHQNTTTIERAVKDINTLDIEPEQINFLCAALQYKVVKLKYPLMARTPINTTELIMMEDLTISRGWFRNSHDLSHLLSRDLNIFALFE